MLKDPIFYVMFIMLICGAFFGLMMISQCSLGISEHDRYDSSESGGNYRFGFRNI